jgi:hypothetical protein
MNKKAFTIAILTLIIGGSGTFLYIDMSTNIFNDNSSETNVNVDLEWLKALCADGVPEKYEASCRLLGYFP